jgi:hypothetical protein
MRFSDDVIGLVKAVAPQHHWVAIASHITKKLKERQEAYRRKNLAAAAAELGAMRFKPPVNKKNE